MNAIKNLYLLLLLLLCFNVKASITSDKDVIIDDNYIFKKIKLHRLGKGKNNVTQGLVIDDKTDGLYTLHVTGKPEKGVVNYFLLVDESNKITAFFNFYFQASTVLLIAGLNGKKLTAKYSRSAVMDFI